MVESKNPFITAYMTSIRLARDIITAQWRDRSWDKKNLNIEQPTFEDEVIAILLHSYNMCVETGDIALYGDIDCVFCR